MVQLREERKLERQKYWKPLIAHENETILNLAWMIQSEVFRTKWLPKGAAPKSVQKIAELKKEAYVLAINVYNEMYRNVSYGSFVMTDSGMDDLDGRIGYIECYDKEKMGFRALVCHRGASNYRDTFHTIVKPANMEPMKKVDFRGGFGDYSKPKVEKCQVAIHHFIPGKEDEIMHVTIWNDVFEKLSGKYRHFEKESHCFDEMRDIMKEKEELESEKNAKLREQKMQYYNSMISFFEKYDPAHTLPRKKFKVHSHDARPTSRETQWHAAWKARFEHIQSMLYDNECDNEHHLFTFPFKTLDNSLVSCCDGLSHLGKHHEQSNMHDAVFTPSLYCKPMVITTSSLNTLRPGQDIDEDVLNFCLNW